MPSSSTTSTRKNASVPENINDGLKQIYYEKIKPLEVAYGFNSTFMNDVLGEAELNAKPIVLVLGQYSTGKTTMLEYLLGEGYPGSHIGPEPTTDRFVAVSWAETERTIPGHAGTASKDLPFSGLAQFGTSFLSKFQVSQKRNLLLESLILVDTPGVLSGEQQRLGRSYDFVRVCEWLAQRADMILLLFDAHKLDVSDEFKKVISNALRGNEDKVRVVLNKADTVTEEELMRVYGALMWSLGKVIQTPEVVRLYVCSFRPNKAQNKQLLTREENELVGEIEALPINAAVRKVNEMIKRARYVRVHVLIMNHLRQEMPSMFGKGSTKARLLANLGEEFAKVQQKYNMPSGDFPQSDLFARCLQDVDFTKLPKLSSKNIAHLEDAITKDLPGLMQKYPMTLGINFMPQVNPFSQQPLLKKLDNAFEWQSVNQERYRSIWISLKLSGEMMPSTLARQLFKTSGLGTSELAAVWRLADIDRDGCLSFEEFCLAMHLIDIVRNGLDLPDTLPSALYPPP